jgi:hypothetical protein
MEMDTNVAAWMIGGGATGFVDPTANRRYEHRRALKAARAEEASRAGATGLVGRVVAATVAAVRRPMAAPAATELTCCAA